jgi:putative nucleotidyltransferase with HDIG domain
MSLRLPRILVVEDQEPIQQLVKALLGVRRCGCDLASRLGEARRLMAGTRYDLLFIDVNLPDGSGLSLVDEGATGSPLVIVMTGNCDLDTAVGALRRGAIDYITKPFTVGHFLQRFDKAMEEWRLRERLDGHARALQTLAEMKTEELSRSTRRIGEIHDETVLALGEALRLKDNETADHCARVSRNSVKMGTLLGLSEFELTNLKWGSYLHDVGKIGVPEEILLKDGPMTTEERLIMERHPAMGVAMIRGISFLVHSMDVVIAHHERFDGAGYPQGLKGADIPLHARIFPFMDTLDAMTADRPYRAALPFSAVTREVEECAGKQFDPELAEIFLSMPEATWLMQGTSCGVPEPCPLLV